MSEDAENTKITKKKRSTAKGKLITMNVLLRTELN
jgi:hypothetical protein